MAKPRLTQPRTYQELHLILTGEREGLSREQVTAIIEPRVAQLKNITEPFGKPSDASKKSLDSGSVTLADGTKWPVDEIDKVAAIALSDHFQIDQIHALVLFRAFIYNEGLPNEALANETGSFTEQLIKIITPFYLSERLSILRVLIPLFRANESELDHAYDYATIFYPRSLRTVTVPLSSTLCPNINGRRKQPYPLTRTGILVPARFGPSTAVWSKLFYSRSCSGRCGVE
jgi:nuclear pore complex protein Nup188